MIKRLLVTLLFAISLHAQPLSPADRKAIVEMTAHLFDTIYVLPERGASVAKSLREKLAAGGYDAATTSAELATLLDADVRTLGQDKHLRVEFVERLANEPVLTPAAYASQERGGRMVREPEASARARATNYGYVAAERLEGNVGYLRIDQFHDGAEMREATAAAAAFIAGSDAVIVDVRDCRGGSAMGVYQLASYFFDAEPRVLMTRYFRPTNQTMSASTVADLPGKRMPKTDLYILTNGRTGSACESFAYILQQFGRAKVVGETSAGAGHNNTFITLGRGIRISISVGRPIHPKTGRGWEGEGVKPDVAVPSAQALLAAHRAAYPKLADPAEELRKTEREWLDAYEKRDSAAMERIVADDFVITHASGSTQTKQDILKMLERGRAANRPSPKFSTEDSQVRLFGDTAVITGKVKMHMGERTNVERYTDTWVRRGGRWVVVASQLSSVAPPSSPQP